MKTKFHNLVARLLIVPFLLLGSCNKGEEVEEDSSEESKSDVQKNAEQLGEKINDLYQQALASGDTVKQNVSDWTEEDYKKIGAWEYKVARLTVRPPTALEEELQKLGDDRWECYWVDELEGDDSSNYFYFKRKKRSYLEFAGKASSFIPIPSGK